MIAPPWWLSADDDALRSYAEWLRIEWPEVDEYTPDSVINAVTADYDFNVWNCRRCCYWSSADGARGQCTAPETSCGVTRAVDLCEQWESRLDAQQLLLAEVAA